MALESLLKFFSTKVTVYSLVPVFLGDKKM